MPNGNFDYSAFFSDMPTYATTTQPAQMTPYQQEQVRFQQAQLGFQQAQFGQRQYEFEAGRQAPTALTPYQQAQLEQRQYEFGETMGLQRAGLAAQAGAMPMMRVAGPQLPPISAPGRPRFATFAAPTRGAAPEFEAPEFDAAEVRKRAQRISGLSLRELRQISARAVQEAMVEEDPYARRMGLKAALQQYGVSVGGVMEQARGVAGAEYEREYGREYAQAQQAWQVQLQREAEQYQLAVDVERQRVQQVNQAAMQQFASAYQLFAQRRMYREQRGII